MTSSTSKYRFSFTAGSLMLVEMVRVAQLMIDQGLLLDQVTADSLQRDKLNTQKRAFVEIKLRLNTLSPEEIRFLAETDVPSQKLLCLVAFARSYAFFRDFVEEVILEKLTLFDHQITDRDYSAFISRKSVDHEELYQLTDVTKSKIKQVIFKTLEQAGLIDNIKERNIQVPILSTGLEHLLKNKPKDLQLLLLPEYRNLTA